MSSQNILVPYLFFDVISCSQVMHPGLFVSLARSLHMAHSGAKTQFWRPKVAEVTEIGEIWFIEIFEDAEPESVIGIKKFELVTSKFELVSSKILIKCQHFEIVTQEVISPSFEGREISIGHRNVKIYTNLFKK